MFYFHFDRWSDTIEGLESVKSGERTWFGVMSSFLYHWIGSNITFNITKYWSISNCNRYFQVLSAYIMLVVKYLGKKQRIGLKSLSVFCATVSDRWLWCCSVYFNVSVINLNLCHNTPTLMSNLHTSNLTAHILASFISNFCFSQLWLTGNKE